MTFKENAIEGLLSKLESRSCSIAYAETKKKLLDADTNRIIRT